MVFVSKDPFDDIVFYTTAYFIRFGFAPFSVSACKIENKQAINAFLVILSFLSKKNYLFYKNYFKLKPKDWFKFEGQ